MKNDNYIFKSDLIMLIHEQTGLTKKQSLVEANRIISEESFSEKSLANRIFDFAGSAVYSGAAQYFIEEILEYLKIPPKSIIGLAISNFIENLRLDQLKDYAENWEDGRCEALMKSLIDTVSESVVEYAINELMQKFNDSDMGSKIGIAKDSPIKDIFGGYDFDSVVKLTTSIVREKLFDTIFTQEQRVELSQLMCDKLSELDLSGMLNPFGSDEEEE